MEDQHGWVSQMSMYGDLTKPGTIFIKVTGDHDELNQPIGDVPQGCRLSFSEDVVFTSRAITVTTLGLQITGRVLTSIDAPVCKDCPVQKSCNLNGRYYKPGQVTNINLN